MANVNTSITDFTIPGSASVSGTSHDWQYLCSNCGFVDSVHAFEDSTVSAPESDSAPGFLNQFRKTAGNPGNCNTERCKWVLSEPSPSYGPSTTSSFPYMYKIGLNGGTDSVYESSLVTPIYTISGIGESSFAWDMSVCLDYGTGAYVYVGGALWMRVNGGQWQHVNMPSYTDTQYLSLIHI